MPLEKLAPLPVPGSEPQEDEKARRIREAKERKAAREKVKAQAEGQSAEASRQQIKEVE